MRNLFLNKKQCTIFVIVMFTALLSSQELIQYKGETEKYVMVERSDWRRYDNGKYTGLTSREIRSYVSPIASPDNVASSYKNHSWFQGNFLVYEDTKSSGRSVAQGIDGMMPSLFHIADDGKLTVVPVVAENGKSLKDTGFPTFRSFPTYPSSGVKIGDSWTSEGVRAVDPLHTGIYTKLKIVVQYTFVGQEVYKEVPVYRIKAKWATRYGSGTVYQDYDGDKNLINATGSHNADILVSVETGAAILIRDNLDETFTYKDGNSVQFKGTTLLFTEFPPAIDRDSLMPALNRIASVVDSSVALSSSKEDSRDVIDPKVDTIMPGMSKPATSKQDVTTPDVTKPASGKISQQKTTEVTNAAAKNNMVVEETTAGLRLSVRDIRFAANSAEIVPEEKSRLDEIAAVLRLVPEGQFLIEGHSASTGNPVGEKNLSVERAKKIADELTKRGISADRFLYTGYGSERPIVSNDTTEGRAQNRRVEITILE